MDVGIFADWFGNVDWHGMLVPDTPLLEIFARGTIIYLSLLFLLRVVVKRQAGAVGISDLLVVVLIADASQNAMADDYKAIPDGIALVATILFWDYVIDALGFHVPFIQKLLHPPPLNLIKNGEINYRNLRKELISKAELMSQLREQGIEKISQVKTACMEGDGQISVVPFDKNKDTGNNNNKRKGL